MEVTTLQTVQEVTTLPFALSVALVVVVVVLWPSLLIVFPFVITTPQTEQPLSPLYPLAVQVAALAPTVFV